ncbi:MAG TPA: nicotinate-nucleotide adenylyltransferase [Pelagibacterium sp.]|uniref:nicotinate-nucleotide adenylyltransferase n=1 Tax=Pelagibacterium sp. TaxID=1967288 RepID=UPI002C9DAC36|nr:nicotinate-nucleotide adenylyltransferase [Pelagibacterium sp.]HWJ87874.1 nicotinate-nucleotide adenylyltransferase [Pelagibacterium sp.]
MTNPVVIPGITDLPPSAPGMRIGLFGGSFNPPHAGHRLVSHESLKRLKLDAIWWLVTPGNPLKDRTELAPLTDRVLAARAIADHPRVKVTAFEAAHGFTYTYQTIAYLTRTLPDRRFVWIMGADGLSSFHLWERWEDIFSLVPIAVYVRPGSTRRAPFSKAALRFSNARIEEADAVGLATMPAPAWVFLHGLMSPLSSTQLRDGTALDPKTAPSD